MAGTPQRSFKPTPPMKGSFPLDHDAECKDFMTRYMTCLQENELSTNVCKPLSKEYLGCRMQRGLMELEEFRRLGFVEDVVVETTDAVKNDET